MMIGLKRTSRGGQRSVIGATGMVAIAGLTAAGVLAGVSPGASAVEYTAVVHNEIGSPNAGKRSMICVAGPCSGAKQVPFETSFFIIPTWEGGTGVKLICKTMRSQDAGEHGEILYTPVYRFEFWEAGAPKADLTGRYQANQEFFTSGNGQRVDANFIDDCPA